VDRSIITSSTVQKGVPGGNLPAPWTGWGQRYCALPPLCFTGPFSNDNARDEPRRSSLGRDGEAFGEASFLGLSAPAPQVKGASSLGFSHSHTVQLEPEFVPWRMDYQMLDGISLLCYSSLAEDLPERHSEKQCSTYTKESLRAFHSRTKSYVVSARSNIRGNTTNSIL
jgi:hypothetical protein